MRKVLTDEELVIQSYYVRGYKTLGSRILVNNELKDIYKLLSSLGDDIYYVNFCSSVEDVILSTKKAFDRFYHLHDIPHIKANRVNELSEEVKQLLESGSIEEKYEFLNQIDDERKMINPYEISVHLGNYDSVFNGSITIELIGLPHTDFITDLFIVFPELFIDSLIDDLSPLVYAHELTHTQIESAKSACLDYQNCEVISIFNEKLCALEIEPTGKLLKEIEKRRFKSIKKNIEVLLNPEEHSLLEIFKANYYINSTLKATHLFDKYLAGNNEEKEMIINGIQKIFDGKISVEDLLEDNNITYENSCSAELIKRHI